MSRLAWYWHRLRAMDGAEVRGRLRKKYLERIDARRKRDWTAATLNAGSNYPKLPDKSTVPESFRDALRRDSEDILARRWRAFTHLPIQVSDPPDWHKDYLANIDLPSGVSAFSLDHRALPKGADIKLIWELSRWQHITRLALAAHYLGDLRAAWKCVHWLEHWVQHNPPYRGWNWTSALESGLRLIQFTWIDALLAVFERDCGHQLERLRYDVLPMHVWFTWRHRSFGSSANNHLIGELAGLITATARWPELKEWGTSIDELQALWEAEVLAQFASDGGNKEQALHYHMFSFELSWHAAKALEALGRSKRPEVEERLQAAATFFPEVQPPPASWPYGDSDDAFVLPLAPAIEDTVSEWIEWMKGMPRVIQRFAGEPPKPSEPHFENNGHWRVFRESGIAVLNKGPWFLRWDVSPLGYLSTGAHGHLDALHVSIWLDGVAMIIDPGTGAYYGDCELRHWLASRRAHNGPSPQGEEWPHRAGPFLWSQHHPKPTMHEEKGRTHAEFDVPAGTLRRAITLSEQGELIVEDSMRAPTGSERFTVLWQFAPDTMSCVIDSRKFELHRREARMQVHVSEDWELVDLVVDHRAAPVESREGVVSPHFRCTTWAPYLKMTARAGHKPCVFRTTFLVSPAS